MVELHENMVGSGMGMGVEVGIRWGMEVMVVRDFSGLSWMLTIDICGLDQDSELSGRDLSKQMTSYNQGSG